MKGAVLFLVVCAGLAETSVLDFLSELPKGISKTFSDAWHSFKTVVNKPVRIKRLGSGGRRKQTPTAEATTTQSPATTPTEPPSQSARPHLILPVFVQPKWGARGHWSRKLQQPILEAFKTSLRHFRCDKLQGIAATERSSVAAVTRTKTTTEELNLTFLI